MRLYIFDDSVADGWSPFALTRPCSELLFGSLLLRERLERATGVPAAGIVTRPWLRGFQEPGVPPIVSADAIAEMEDEDRLFLSSRFVPEESLPAGSNQAATFEVAGQTAGVRVPANTPRPEDSWLRHPGPLGDRETELPGTMLARAWELVARNPDRLSADLRAAAERNVPGGKGSSTVTDALPPGVQRIGEQPLLLGPGVRIEPGVLLDTRKGPIRLDAEVEVLHGARLAGPLHVGARSRLLGGPIEALSAGPHCRLRGEIEACVVLGHANKAHAGFLGHAYLGRWVNLGAMTTNSDLKNNYSTVRVGPPEDRVDTGLLKFGCLLGDHVKTGIGLLISTGCVVGAGSNLIGEGSLPTWVPPFSWGFGDRRTPHRKEAFVRTAEIVMARRQVTSDRGTRRWLSAVWEAGCGADA